MKEEALLDVRRLAVDYLDADGRPAHALVDVDLQVRPGEMVGIVGESGCGKTTLLLALLRLLPVNGRIVAGEVVFQGRDLLALREREMRQVRGRQIGMVFQGALHALNPVQTIERQIGEAVRLHRAVRRKREVRERVAELLNLVGIVPQRGDAFPHQLSGGMRQRAMIAMALAGTPRLLIADEPTTALDVIVQAQILDLLQTLREQLGLAVVVVTHDLGVVAELCDAVTVMYGGVVAEVADIDAIFNQPRHPYTRRLLAAFPDLSPSGAPPEAIPGQPPALTALPAGCRFAPRCAEALEKCHSRPPALLRIGEGHLARCYLLEGEHE